MKLSSLLVSLALATGAALSAQTITREGAWEKLALVSATAANTWSPAECTVQPSTERVKGAPSSWRWHIEVDHFAGEPKYPIGWPRIGHALPEGALRDWSQWDFLHLWVYVETSRAALPKEPAGLGLLTPDRASGYNRALPELRKDQWVELNLPIAQIPRNTDVRNIQFHIAESNYRHGDRLDIYLNDLALVRHAVPNVVDLAPANAVLFSDARRLTVRFRLVGVKPDGVANVTCELRRDGAVAARITRACPRGTQELDLPFDSPGRAGLAPGLYQLRAAIAGTDQSAASSVRIVESPWSQP